MKEKTITYKKPTNGGTEKLNIYTLQGQIDKRMSWQVTENQMICGIIWLGILKEYLKIF